MWAKQVRKVWIEGERRRNAVAQGVKWSKIDKCRELLTKYERKSG